MILKTPESVIDFRWAESENKDDYITLFSGFASPKFLVSDGHISIESACKKVWKTTKIQRCLVHINRFVRNHAGVKPTNPANISIRVLANKLFKIDTLKKARNWTLLFLASLAGCDASLSLPLQTAFAVCRLGGVNMKNSKMKLKKRDRS